MVDLVGGNLKSNSANSDMSIVKIHGLSFKITDLKCKHMLPLLKHLLKKVGNFLEYSRETLDSVFETGIIFHIHLRQLWQPAIKIIMREKFDVNM